MRKVEKMVEYKVESVTLPAGKYWVGDPCYAVQDYGLWDRIGASNAWFQKSIVAEADGKFVVGVGTAYGDGVYRDQEGREYGVDAGLLGVAPDEDWVEQPAGMHLIEFPHEFTVYRDETRVVIGHVVIETADEEEETCAHCGEELDGFGHCWCMEDEEEE